jgi:hypothetical protein
VIAYEIYSFDANEEDKVYFLGILPERRNDPLRITRESILNLAKMVIRNVPMGNSLYFNQVEVQLPPCQTRAGRSMGI